MNGSNNPMNMNMNGMASAEAPGPAGKVDGFSALMEHLDRSGVTYRVVRHEPEGRTDAVSLVRGNRLSQAAKAMVVAVKVGKHLRRHVNVVVPGDCRLDFAAVAALFGGSEARMAAAEKAEELTGCPMGAVIPFSFNPGLALVVDPRLVEEPEIVFNAGRLDVSVFLSSDDFLRAARPRLAEVGRRSAH